MDIQYRPLILKKLSTRMFSFCNSKRHSALTHCLVRAVNFFTHLFFFKEINEKIELGATRRIRHPGMYSRTVLIVF
jgi:hypothetical protein